MRDLMYVLSTSSRILHGFDGTPNAAGTTTILDLGNKRSVITCILVASESGPGRLKEWLSLSS